MADEIDGAKLPQATIEPKKRLRLSVVWIIPILAAVVAVGILIQRLMNEGPEITVVFKAAEGIEAGKTLLKFKDVTVGTVTAVHLSEDYTRVVVKAKMAKFARGLLVEDTRFWVVAPRITLSGVSGLGTLLSGNYIGLQPGKSRQRRHSFTGLDAAPEVTGQPGRQFVLEASSLSSVGVGSPVYYRSLRAGQVLGFGLSDDGKSIAIRVFVDAPYDQYVTAATRFWNVSGIEVSAGAGGVQVHMESLATLLEGGVAFNTPEFVSSGQPAPANARFTLYENKTLAMKQPDKRQRRFVLNFDQPVRGLSVGAPVDFLGMPVGQVTDLSLSYNPTTLVYRPRVVITFYLDRLISRLTAKDRATVQRVSEMSEEDRVRLLRRMVEEKGLRGELKSASLLTGELYVGFAYYPHARKPRLDWSTDPLELPVIQATGLTSVEAKLDDILAKVDRMPLEAMGGELKDLLATLDATLKDADTLIGRANTDLLPESAKALRALHGALADADQVLFGKGSPAMQDLRDTLQELAGAARAMRALADYLERHPEALIRGKKQE